MEQSVLIIGGGLAGSEAAWQLAERKIPVTLLEMRPEVTTEAHISSELAELVCSNSFGSMLPATGAGVLQQEAERLGSLIMACAREQVVPAGRALAVDRVEFARAVSRLLAAHPMIRIERRLVTHLPLERPLLLCTGPLTHPCLAEELRTLIGCDNLSFFDAISPIVAHDSLNHDKVYSASRYDDGPGDYLNCPFTREEYEAFVDAILSADVHAPHAFEADVLFNGCQPVEAIARGGRASLAFGPMRPVGLTHPRTGQRPHAVVQLRREDRDGLLWNMVGFQTRLRHGEQRRVFRMIPGLEEAEFVRLGSVHKNTFVNAPRALTSSLSLQKDPQIWLGGQICGVEGYLESTVCGLMAALNIVGALRGLPVEPPPPETMTGALLKYLREAPADSFQPMNANFGILPPLAEQKLSKKDRKPLKAKRAAEAFQAWVERLPKELGIPQGGKHDISA